MVTVAVPAQPLSRALAELGRQARIDILVSSATVGGRRSAALRGRLTPDEALQRLLAGSGLEFEALEADAYVVRPRRGELAVVESAPTALPELLVVGVRTQNVDQRRDPDDIQPYRVFERSTLRAAQALSADDFLQTWLTSNGDSRQAVPQVTRGTPPSRSKFSFRDPNAMAATLVLVDGRRMPFIPSQAELVQADVGPIPLAAISRIETLTSSSGALYGLGAVNGVVNLVLDRDYRGAEVSTTVGSGKGGDGDYGRFDARLGFSTDDGDTALMVSYGQKRFNGVAIGDRKEAYAPLDGSSLGPGQWYSRPSGNGTTLLGVNGPFVVGGVAMTKTYIPADYDGSTPIETVLIRNAGKSAPGLAPAHRDRLLSTDSRTDAVLVNLRQRLWRGAEAYLDYIYLSSLDTYPIVYGAFSATLTPGRGPATMISGSGPIELVAPLPYAAGPNSVKVITRRFTAGLVFDLPARWRGGVDYAEGSLRARHLSDIVGFDIQASPAVASGVGPGDGRTAPNPFGDQARFVADLDQYSADWAPSAPYGSSRLEDISLRASGPIGRIGDRDLTLSLTAQQLSDSLPYITDLPGSGLSSRTRSLFAELRAPLDGVVGVRGLELQAAVRRQTGRVRIAYASPWLRMNKAADLYLIGVKAEPLDGLILRGSFASGGQLPEPRMLSLSAFTSSSSLADPKRDPSHPIYSEGWFWHVQGAPPDLRPDQTRTYSVGTVLASPLLPRTRLSVDYTRIEGHDLMVQVRRGVDFYILNEARYPGAVVRAPLTDADRAKGYTGGRIIEVRDLSENTGSSLLESVDIVAEHDLQLAGGRLSLTAALTWQPTLSRYVPPDSGAYKRTPDGGTPEWRGAVGARWATDRFAASATVRYIDANLPTALPERTTVDLSVGWDLPTPPGASETELRLGVRNLFDRWSDDDPLKRRLEATLVARF
ncbi:TonB-dependent receptor [Caulobacter endophyticus]|uniref:TonB-dependent receptor n=1 Tax=Caulobacter endophyticus TaxID=2172652 RepID=UPI00241065E2|nr:TonB-dependent receptor [Caulobacter endophyticus]MDG2530702.1 TonB-dependent receptor [Caulobacter endophyticus]